MFSHTALSEETEVCYHCGESCGNSSLTASQKSFCCSGCKMVYDILNKSDLCNYYELNTNPGSAQKESARENKFIFLDNPEIIRKLISFTDSRQTQVTFYLPQIHCSSCLWLLENIYRLNDGIVSSRVDFIKKEVYIVFNPGHTSLRAVVETLASIGYEPYLNIHDTGDRKIKHPSRKRLYQIGISGFCFANIMMMSLPEYFSLGGYMENDIGIALHYFIVALSLPVIFYCASEFFVAAWKGLKNRFLNIDVPIALAIAITFLRSIYELMTGTGSGYMDSMAGIVFFMLVGRLVQDRTYLSLSFDRDFRSFFPIAVNVFKNGHFEPVMAEQIKADDLIQIHANELIPADGILSKGHAEIDYSFVSGESIPVSVKTGAIIYAGGKQLGSNIELIVVKEVSQSYLTSLWNKDIFRQEKQQTSFIHALSKYFTAAVLFIGLIASIYWFALGNTLFMWNALTTVLIVACPCALLLSSTFTNGNILRLLSKHHFYLRHPDVIESLAKTDHIVFDKTGTLTENKKAAVSYEGAALNPEQQYCIRSLIAQSNHPLSRIIYEYMGPGRQEPISSFKELPGKGIEAWIKEQHIKIGSEAFIRDTWLKKKDQQSGSFVFVQIGETVPGYFRITNLYRAGLEQMISMLRQKVSLSLLSGDNNAEEKHLRRLLGNEASLKFYQHPEEKLDYIRALQESGNRSVLMIGDGLNDAGALRQSNTGIAVTDGIHNFTPASDGILDAARLTLLPRFIAFAQSGRKIIMVSFILSILYNITGLYFAVQGILSPLIAAILMPASSISIILITFGLSEYAAKKQGL